MKYCRWADSKKNVCENKLSPDNPIACCLQISNLLIISIHPESDIHYRDSLKAYPSLKLFSIFYFHQSLASSSWLWKTLKPKLKAFLKCIGINPLWMLCAFLYAHSNTPTSTAVKLLERRVCQGRRDPWQWYSYTAAGGGGNFPLHCREVVGGSNRA